MGKTGKQKGHRSLFRRFKSGTRSKRNIERGIEHDKGQVLELAILPEPGKVNSVGFGRFKTQGSEIHSRNALEKFAYEHFSPMLPQLPRYREAFEQSGLPIIFESYASTAILLSIVAMIAGAIFTLLFEIGVLHFTIFVAAIEAIGLSATTFSFSILLWLLYPLQRRRTFKSKLEGQLSYSFGILGVLSAAGISIERMFERIAMSDSNPILADLAKRFIRNIKVFGLDTESALKEVSRHSPSPSFAKMLDSIAVAFRTTGSVHGLIMFESNRLLTEKSDKMKKKIGDLSIMAELYITLVVVGPIIFIVMLSILQLLPYSGSLPSIQIINALVFVGIPVISVGFTLILDSMVQRI